MYLKNQKVRSSKLYSIGYMPFLKEYVLESVVPWVAWYSRYYRITVDEYCLYQTDPQKLDELADEFYQSENKHKRFLFSGKASENAPEQQEQFKQACEYCMTKHYVADWEKF